MTEENVDTLFPVYFKKSEVSEEGIIKEAARSENRSASNFIRDAALEKAKRVLESKDE